MRNAKEKLRLAIEACDWLAKNELQPYANRAYDAAEFLRKYQTVHNDAIEEAANRIEAHSCVASCCDAQPSAGEAKSLADCVRRLKVKT